MAEHIWTVLCGRVLTDADTQILSLVDIAESVTVEGLGRLIDDAVEQGKKGALLNSSAHLVSWWFKSDPNEDILHARFVFQNPAGETLNEQTADFPWEKDTIFLRVRLHYPKLPVTMPGLYWFVVEQQSKSKSAKPRWVKVTRLPLHVSGA